MDPVEFVTGDLHTQNGLTALPPMQVNCQVSYSGVIGYCQNSTWGKQKTQRVQRFSSLSAEVHHRWDGCS